MSETRIEWLGSFDEITDEAKAAEAALTDLGRLSQRQRELLFPILRVAFHFHRRGNSRFVERSLPIGEVFDGETSVERRQLRLDSTFPLPDGRRVSWSEATVEDHEARIGYLRAVHLAGILRTISEHEAAVELIRRFGVSCLAEIEGAA